MSPNVFYPVMKSKSATESVIRDAQDEIRKLAKQRAAIDSRLAKLRKSVRILTELLKDAPGYKPSNDPTESLGLFVGSGLTEAIRKLLRTHGSLSTRQLREKLKEHGLNINAYASGLTIIHNTLKRLEHQKEIYLEKGPNGTTAHLLPKDKCLNQG